MVEFKVGDRVKIVYHNCDGYGKMGTITLVKNTVHTKRGNMPDAKYYVLADDMKQYRFARESSIKLITVWSVS